MPSEKERFFLLESFAIVGCSKEKPFPKLTHANLKKMGKEIYPVDLDGGGGEGGEEILTSLDEISKPVAGVIIEVPKERTMEVLRAAAEKGIQNVWIHMGCDTPEVLQFCADKGIQAQRGTCAVMYTQQGFSYHSIHKWIMKLAGKY